jgi:hypothetical protein
LQILLAKAELLVHAGQQAGAEFLLEMLHDGEAGADPRSGTQRHASLLSVAKEFAALHVSIIEHFCSIRNAGAVGRRA